MRWLLKLFMAVNSVIIIGIVYAAKEEIYIKNFGVYSLGIYVIAAILWAGICLLCCNVLSQDNIKGGITSIELANDSYLPTYLGYFFVALSINNTRTLVVVFLVLLVLLMHSQNLYYNPFFLLYGYKFYLITRSTNLRVLVISKQEIKSSEGLQFNNLRRINDFTFFDQEVRLR